MMVGAVRRRGPWSSAMPVPSEATFFASLPPVYRDLLLARAALVNVGTGGALYRNVGGFSDVAAQREALWLLYAGLLTNDTTKMDVVVAAMEYAFAQQEPAGNFANGLSYAADVAAGTDAFFLQAFARVFLLIQGSAYRATHLPPLVRLLSAARRALGWLEEHTGALYAQDGNTVNRLLFDALAFRAVGTLVADVRLASVADGFVDAALAGQDVNGVFNEHGGHDSSYQMVSVVNLAVLLRLQPAGARRQAMTAALAAGTTWGRSRILETGEVVTTGNTRTGPGFDKDVNYPEVALALLYAGRTFGDAGAVSAGELVSAYTIDFMSQR